LRRGEPVDTTKRKRVIARLLPAEPVAAKPKTPARKPELPDFMARLREICGIRILKPSNAELIARDRDRY
jgi:antitoxin (DNA-binding transcriptional repressor) of toxin-antitoxin stability system